MAEPRVDLYSVGWCGYCRAARRLLDAREIPYRFHDLTGDYPAIDDVKKRFGHYTVPVVLLDGALVGGYTELSSAIASRGVASFLP